MTLEIKSPLGYQGGMTGWTQLGLAIGQRVHHAPKNRVLANPKKPSRSKPIRKEPPPLIHAIVMAELDDPLDDLFV
jgi:hypothetical protein